MLNPQKVLRSPFDIEVHKETFFNYLEVIIKENGVVEYAVPSHQEKLISIACKKEGISRDELGKRCPVEFYFDFMTWLCQMSGCVALWNDRMEGKANEKQQETIRGLINEGLYRGNITV